MDFSVGEEFEREVHRRFGVQVHHDSPSPRGSFFLLATFRHFLFLSLWRSNPVWEGLHQSFTWWNLVTIISDSQCPTRLWVFMFIL